MRTLLNTGAGSNSLAALHCEGKELQVSTAIEPFGSYITNLEGEIIFEKYLLRCLLSPTARFSIIGTTENSTSHKWGLLVSFKDYSSHEKKLEIPLSCIYAKNSSFFRNILCDGGYSCRKGFPPDVLFERIQQDLSWYPPVTRITKVGWQRAPEVYILPKRIYGTFDQSKYHFECSCSGYRNHGNLQEWGQLAETAVGNTRFVFALCAAFAAVLLTPLGIEGGGFNFVGESSSGKTTALKIASSVWGNDIISWNSTINALENIASEHNDNLLVLDELGEMDSGSFHQTVYMLANGFGKNRSSGNGKLQEKKSWRCLFLSSGEVGLMDKLSEKKASCHDGQRVRFLDIPVRADMIMHLHGRSSAAQLVSDMVSLADQYTGTAGPQFLEWLTENLPSRISCLKRQLKQKEDMLCGSEEKTVIRRAARRFALVWIAGEAAWNAEILPFEMDIEAAVRSCYDDWLKDYENSSNQEQQQFLYKFRACIERNRSKFIHVSMSGDNVSKLIGYYNPKSKGTEYLFSKATFHTMFPQKKAVEWLKQAGCLKTRKDRDDNERVVCGKKGYYYVVVLPKD